MTGIIQVVQTTKTDTFTSAAAGWVAVTGLSAMITPGSIANKILIFSKINLAADGSNGVAYKVQRNGVDIDLGAADGTKPAITLATGTAFGNQFALDSGMSISEMFVDSPGVIVPLTYQIFVWKGNSPTGVFINRGVTDGNASNYYRTTSNIVLMEFQP